VSSLKSRQGEENGNENGVRFAASGVRGWGSSCHVRNVHGRHCNHRSLALAAGRAPRDSWCLQPTRVALERARQDGSRAPGTRRASREELDGCPAGGPIASPAGGEQSRSQVRGDGWELQPVHERNQVPLRRPGEATHGSNLRPASKET